MEKERSAASITLREHFASLVLQASISSDHKCIYSKELHVKFAIDCAELLIAELEK